MEKLFITPKTKIHDLLRAYPDLEHVLIEMAPQFSKLKNPVLRNTIAKVTTLNQAATIAGLNTEGLINRLRKETGQSMYETSATEDISYQTSRPDWFEEESVISVIDIREMLHAGEQPVHEVLSSLKSLKKNEIQKVIAPFIPAPLLDKSISLGYKHWLDRRSEEEFWIYFIR